MATSGTRAPTEGLTGPAANSSGPGGGTIAGLIALGLVVLALAGFGVQRRWDLWGKVKALAARKKPEA